jgi:hypothetical protein
MLSLIFLAFVVAVKVYKKTTPNGKFLVGLLLITELPVFELIVPFLISLKNNISIFFIRMFYFTSTWKANNYRGNKSTNLLQSVGIPNFHAY